MKNKVNSYDISDWVRSSWIQMVKRMPTNKKVKPSIEQLLNYDGFPVSRMTLYKLLNRQDNSRRVRQSTINKLNTFFSQQLSEDSQWSAWKPKGLRIVEYQPISSEFFSTSEHGQCRRCKNTFPLKDGTTQKIKTYFVSTEVNKKPALNYQEEVELALCETCYGIEKEWLLGPWNQTIQEVHSRIAISPRELSKVLGVSLTTLHRYSNNYDTRHLTKKAAQELLHLLLDYAGGLSGEDKRQNDLEQDFFNILKDRYGLWPEKAKQSDITFFKSEQQHSSQLSYHFGLRISSLVCFFVKSELSSSEDYLEHINKALQMKAKFVCFISLETNEKRLEQVSSLLSENSVVELENQFGFSMDLDLLRDFDTQCFNISKFPFEVCDIPQGQSILFFRRLSDRNNIRFQKLDRLMKQYIEKQYIQLKDERYKTDFLNELRSSAPNIDVMADQHEFLVSYTFAYFDIILSAIDDVRNLNTLYGIISEGMSVFFTDLKEIFGVAIEILIDIFDIRSTKERVKFPRLNILNSKHF